jgi:hypothetical protein
MGSSRKRYSYGDKIHLTIPNYIDQLTIDWINSQPAIATKVWETLMKAAHNEIVQADPISILKALGLENFGELNGLLKGSQDTNKDSRMLKDSPQKLRIKEQISTGTGEEVIGMAQDPERQITGQKYENGNDVNLIQAIQNDTMDKDMKLNEEVKDIYRKDGHMDLKAMTNKTSGGRRGLSRNTVRTQLDTNKPNLMEQEMYGDK